MTVYGIPNCDTVQKAVKWFKANNVDFEFHDFKKEGVEYGTLLDWVSRAGIERVLNKQSTTWKELSPENKELLNSPVEFLKLIQEKTSMIKRPVIDDVHFLFFGFDEAVYKKQFLK
ncbi:MAG: Spx/MgsR family RNA polymerase-binding regulatory protein [Sphingobacteriales bacterium]